MGKGPEQTLLQRGTTDGQQRYEKMLTSLIIREMQMKTTSLALTWSGKGKGHWLNSQSGHMPGLKAPSPTGACARGNRSMFFSHFNVSLSFSLPSPLSKNKFKKSVLKTSLYKGPSQ